MSKSKGNKKVRDDYGARCGTIIGAQAKRIKELEKELRETKDGLRKAKPKAAGRSISMLVMDEFVPGEKMAMLEVKSYPEQREVVPVAVDMVFEDWKKMGLPVEPETYIELSEHEFHGGTCFPGIILLDADNAQELRGRLAEGYQPTFWLSQKERPSTSSGPAVPAEPSGDAK